MATTEHEAALTKAKIALMSKTDSAFFTTICFSLKFKWEDKIPTAGTNGKDLYFSPKFFMELNAEERVFVLVHEAMHVAYMHVDKNRLGSRDPKKWNIAADHVINLQLIERGFKMPTGNHRGLADAKYKNMSTEQVYDLLPELKEEEYDGDVMFGEGSPEEQEQAMKEVQDIIVRASIQSKMAGDKPGSIPGDIEIFLDRLLNPKLPWNRILQKYLHKYDKNDFTFKKPNRRFFPTHYLPSLHSQALMDLAIAVDISGSVSDSDFNRFVTEIHSILKMMKPEKITLIQFDTAIHAVDKVRNVQELMKVKFSGRGGTDFHPVAQWVNKNKPQALMVFTDGEFNFYNEEAKTDVMWLIHDNKHFKPPYGKVIHYEMKD
jgi:predicted metal-dependent peptidase